jgi:hypothetical protein
MCRTCYFNNYKAKKKIVNCVHTNKKYFAKGMCQKCYSSNYYGPQGRLQSVPMVIQKETQNMDANSESSPDVSMYARQLDFDFNYQHAAPTE